MDVKDKEISQLRTELDQLKEQVQLIASHLQEDGLEAEHDHGHGHGHGHAESPTRHSSNQDDVNAPVIAPKVQKPIIQLNNGRND